MKILIFLIVLALVAAVVLWRVRKTDAERNLARAEAIKQKQEQRKVAITPVEDMEWPVMIRPAGNHLADKDKEIPEPSMTSIEFEPVDQTSLQH